jgi:hypothetical protein
MLSKIKEGAGKGRKQARKKCARKGRKRVREQRQMCLRTAALVVKPPDFGLGKTAHIRDLARAAEHIFQGSTPDGFLAVGDPVLDLAGGARIA